MSDKLKQIILETIKAVLTAILAVLSSIAFTSCGVTKATIQRPAEGTTTTVTITTNNPITTTTTPNFNLE